MNINLNTNLISSSLIRSLYNNQNSLSLTMQRLSSGIKINSASDDAANLALSEKIKSKTSGLDQASRNIQTSLSTLQTYDGYLGNMINTLQRTRELALQAMNGVYSDSERNMLNTETQALLSETEQASNAANREIGAKTANATGFIEDVDQLTEEEAIAQGYDDAHIIKTAEEFKNKISADLSGDFVLVSDVDMSELGTLSNSVITGTFTGELDGNGHKVKNLSIDTGGAAGGMIGLFSQTIGATIKNIGIENANINAVNKIRVGAIVGYQINNSIVSNSYSQGNIQGADYIGGLVGTNQSSNIESSYSEIEIIGNNYTGGLLGYSGSNSIIKNNYSISKINGNNYSGGLIGLSVDNTNIDNYSISKIKANNYVGGFIGLSSNSINKYNYSEANVKGGYYVGGFIGDATMGGINEFNYTFGNVSGNRYIGGFIGWQDVNIVNNNYTLANVSGNIGVGGFAGRNLSGAVTNSYATGSVSGNDQVGGFVGNISGGTITNSYSTGSVSGTTNVGGFLGQLTGGTVDATNFWDTEKSGMSTSAGSAVGLTTTQIDNKEGPISSWDSSVWNINTGTPSLIWDQDENSYTVQTGADTGKSSSVQYKYAGINFNEIGGLNIDLSSISSASESLTLIDNALNYLSKKRATIGTNINSMP